MEGAHRLARRALLACLVGCCLVVQLSWRGGHDSVLAAVMPAAPAGVDVRRKRFALFIDSDAHGPANWAPALQAVRGEGDVVAACLFLAAGSPQSEDPSWKSTLDALGIQAKVVPADEASLELAAEAAQLVAEGKVEVIALAVKDGDFHFLAEKIQECVQVFSPGAKFEMMEIG
mmetsp:Transcript_152489/g.489063  ORF Transcript_152489/g.489063 Transcript_152489/m.489063 type:complete len:174 (+) Transcript_152489:54-575(+)|eukprot:CAMPEP_0203868744 /NCGR_PEP_ID=MMETSP0359-20131031/17291_1 /ASSEMBLY_ACC=CAM_ASM_000338 /TAXON_ID=268821 /ORGANISM="Scrippsiella Hangoei, Strain SHTV-5" /LENGTH=173 /DNA_ID=CAMNT_0050787217 /DNA_START=31 /DNA_END=552 /DNA_ORIENTATION=-